MVLRAPELVHDGSGSLLNVDDVLLGALFLKKLLSDVQQEVGVVRCVIQHFHREGPLSPVGLLELLFLLGLCH